MNAEKVIITDLTTSEVHIMPVTPEKVTVGYRGNFSSYDVLDIGEVKVPSGVQLSSISFDSFFPNSFDCELGYVHVEDYKDSKILHDKIERIKIDGRKARVMITNSPINFDCYVESFDCNFQEFTGRIYYSIKFIQAKDLEVVTVEETPKEDSSETSEDPQPEETANDLTTEGRDDSSQESATHNSYEVKSGDCLYFIAEQYYGDGNRWTEIYDANQEVVGSNPDLIYPGQNLVIP